MHRTRRIMMIWFLLWAHAVQCSQAFAFLRSGCSDNLLLSTKQTNIQASCCTVSKPRLAVIGSRTFSLLSNSPTTRCQFLKSKSEKELEETGEEEEHIPSSQVNGVQGIQNETISFSPHPNVMYSQARDPLSILQQTNTQTTPAHGDHDDNANKQVPPSTLYTREKNMSDNTLTPPPPPSTMPGVGGEQEDQTVRASATAASDALSIPPELIEILPAVYDNKINQENYENENSENNPTNPAFIHQSGPAFVNMFRGSAVYIARHRNSVMVYHIPGEMLELAPSDRHGSSDKNQDVSPNNGHGKDNGHGNGKNKLFQNMINDIALTWLLGVRIIIVVGCRSLVDRRMKQLGQWPPERHGGVRVTNEKALRVVKEEAGFVRFEVERQLARALRQGSYFLGGGSSEAVGMGNVVSGNFYTAMPYGIVDGVDHQYTGMLRRVEVDKIRRAHMANDIVLLTNLGASPSGELFNVNTETLASGVAGAVGASKIVFFSLAGTELRDGNSGKHIQSLRQPDAKRLLEYHGVAVRRGGYAVIDSDTEQHPAVIEMLLKIGWSLMALQSGVRRAHIIPPVNGALLQELFTRDGSGTLISRDIYEGIRRATVDDVAGIYELIKPLVQAGTLVPRSKSTIEKDVGAYFVYTRENHIVACGQLKRFEEGFAEIGCLVVDKAYRSQGRGDAMLGYLERLCAQSSLTNVFVLSTQTMQFFVERGFRQATVEDLPPSRQATYNFARKSQIYLKRIDDRDLDVSEMLWDV